MKGLITRLYRTHNLTGSQLADLIENCRGESKGYLIEKALETKRKYYGNKVFLRGLIEFTNYCSKNCYYCGIRRGNQNVSRYRLSCLEILNCCQLGYALGYRTFVLQGGEDSYYTDDKVVEIIKEIKQKYPDCAVTLSIGEKSPESYQKYYLAGADRYLLRHETATEAHYRQLHPAEQQLTTRKARLGILRKIGYQVGAGFMVGSPYQTAENLVADLLFLQQLQPEMVGIGPFIPHHDTPVKDAPPGGLGLTITMLALTRLLLPTALIPATTALGSIHPLGRELGLMAGANVVMPNLSPLSVRQKYALYDNKVCTGDEAAECRACIEQKITRLGLVCDFSRGDHLGWHDNRKA